MPRKKTEKNGRVQAELPLERSSVKAKLPIKDTFRKYFLEYASYVIMDRAIPDISDGFKPVQRRLMHSMKLLDDGRYHKVANIIGHSMQFHPHGDASIGNALVGMGQKSLLVDTQGNWGDLITGDSAAAPRYIEARLTPFAKEVLYAPHLTDYKKSYDGRNKEPVTLPARFPILLAQGTEGIAVGLSTRILPHNFVEIIDAVICHLQEKPFELLPDFPSSGLADVSEYNDGLHGGKVRVRAKIEIGDGKNVVITEIPYGTTTTALIESIIAANDKGKIKVARIEDNTASVVDIKVFFQRGVDLDNAVDALYAFTDCEVSLSPNGMVIVGGKPLSMSVHDMVVHNADQTRQLLKRDLEHQLDQLNLKWHHKSLVQIFIENRIYLRIEKSKTWESVLQEIDKGLDPFKKNLRQPVVEDDLVMLTEVKMRRISAWDAERAKEELVAIDKEIKEVKKHLRALTAYTIAWFEHLKEKYGQGRERKTELLTFDTIKAVSVVERTEKLYIDRANGFIGTGLKNAEELGPCSSIDDVIAFLQDGNMQVVRVEDKAYVGENILHAQVFKPEHRDSVFNMVYEDVGSGKAWVKRFTVGGITREKLYNLASNAEKPNVLFFSPGEGPYLFIKLRKKPRIQTEIYVNLDEQLVKGRGSGGNVVTRHRISSVRPISKEKYEKNVSE
ncbi:MAG: DNA gyrase/topoisomerase IV subunit A [Planctomycetota bacterium]